MLAQRLVWDRYEGTCFAALTLAAAVWPDGSRCGLLQGPCFTARAPAAAVLARGDSIRVGGENTLYDSGCLTRPRLFSLHHSGSRCCTVAASGPEAEAGLRKRAVWQTRRRPPCWHSEAAPHDHREDACMAAGQRPPRFLSAGSEV